MDFTTYLQQMFTKISKEIPGFISIALIKGDDATLVACYPPESRKELSLMSPFHLQVYKQSVQSLDIESGKDLIKEILITTENKLYVIGSRSPIVVGVLTLESDKANLGLTRMYSKKMADELYVFLKDSNFFHKE